MKGEGGRGSTEGTKAWRRDRGGWRPPCAVRDRQLSSSRASRSSASVTGVSFVQAQGSLAASTGQRNARRFRRMPLAPHAGQWSSATRWLLPRRRGLWENVRSVIPRPRLFFFFPQVEISSRTLTQLDQSTVAQPAVTTVAECSLVSCA